MKKRFFVMAFVPLFVINVAALATLSYNRWFSSKSMAASERTSDTWGELQEQMLLRPEQMKEMQDTRLSFERDIASLRQQMREKRNSLVDETRKASPNLNRIDRIIEELNGLQALVQKKTIRNLLKDKEVLTPQQEKRYFSLFENHVRGQGMRYRRRGDGRGRRRWLKETHKNEEINR
ncbi:MAG: periplasmic heavy metal sensor [Candidatus Aminicenantes bacterium]|nr:periplasmic heavy metal sensor [Candidatus Aminicenantes bacterium]